MKILKKHWSTLLFLIFAALLFFPQTGMPIKIFFNRLIASSPSEIASKEQQKIDSYNWSLNSLNGENINLKRSQGKVIVINIWATWCPPCIAEMPSLQNLYNAYSDQVDFYFIASDDRDKVIQFLEKEKFHFPTYFYNTAAPKTLSSNSLPTTFIIDKTGNIVVKKIGAASWDDEKTRGILEKNLLQ